MTEKDYIIDFAKGFLIGNAQTIVGHPFDTIKTRIQSSKPINIFTLHRGVTFPLLSTSLINSVMFGSYGYFTTITNNDFVSGFASGLVISPIVAPIDKLKIDFQINSKLKISDIKFQEIFKGFSPTMIRESVSTGVYFSTYNYFKKAQFVDGDKNILLSGGIAGIFSWLFTYPIDVIKTRIQSGEAFTYRHAYSQGYLFRGLGVCLFRSFLVNSIGFYIYENIE